MPVFFNNCEGRDHATLYGPGAFYDLETTGTHAQLAKDLQQGTECVVATQSANKQVTFRWFSFFREDVLPAEDRSPTRVFFGQELRSETMSKAAAAATEAYAAFFDVNGNFKQQSVPTANKGRRTT
jgi:hypothetical protein